MTTLALLKFEGVDGSTTFTDETGNQTWAIESGTPEIDTADFKAGAASGLFGGGTDKINTTLATSLSGNFFMECWAKFDSTAASGNYTLFELQDGGNLVYAFYSNSNNRLYFAHSSFTQYVSIDIEDAWHHIAIQRTNLNTLEFWVDGIRYYSLSSYTDNYSGARIGGGLNYVSWPGWIDGFRIIDEQMFFTSFYGNPDPDPQLTYTPQASGQIAIMTPLKVRDESLLIIPYDLSASPKVAIVGEKESEAVCSPIQVWG